MCPPNDVSNAGWQAELDEVRAAFEAALGRCADLAALRHLEVATLGKRGSVSSLLKTVGKRPAAERRAFGAAAGKLRGEVSAALQRARGQIERAERDAELRDDRFDVTLPGLPPRRGSRHPIAIVQAELEDVFQSMGFHVLDYPEVDSEFHNFEGLNIPSWHPARDMQDTFWLEGGHVLRTHTSNGQVRAMHAFEPPFRAIFPGKVFRYEATDASHEHTFHQLEGLMIDRQVTVGHLLESMRTLLSAVFGRPVEVRLRPGYFPFVEPGFELDIACQVCGGGGCAVCKHSGWVELLPCGLVHPNVLRAGGLDPDVWQGWAFGLGLSRLVMMRYEVPDIRLLLSGDVRFLSQFPA